MESDRPALTGYARKILGRKFREDAEDVLQEALLKQWQTGAPPSAIATIVRTAAIDLMRTNSRKKRRHDTDVPLDALLERAAPEEPDPLVLEETQAKVREAIDSLSDTKRRALHAIYWEDASYADLRASEEVPLGTIKSRLHQAHDQLRSRLRTA